MVSSPYMLTGWGERSSFGWGCLGPRTGPWEQNHRWREGERGDWGGREEGGAEWPLAGGLGNSSILSLFH